MKTSKMLSFTVVKKLKKGDLKNYSRAEKVFQFIIQWISG